MTPLQGVVPGLHGPTRRRWCSSYEDSLRVAWWEHGA